MTKQFYTSENDLFFFSANELFVWIHDSVADKIVKNVVSSFSNTECFRKEISTTQTSESIPWQLSHIVELLSIQTLPI